MTPWDDSAASKDDIAQLVYLSNLIGGNLALVQPGGGNISVKLEEDDVFGVRVQALVVKGSGTDLRTITAAGFTHLYLDRLAVLRQRDAMSDEEMMSLMRACMLREDDPLPSVETPLHSLIPQRFVAHTHDIASLSLTDTPSARDHVDLTGQTFTHGGYSHCMQGRGVNFKCTFGKEPLSSVTTGR